ncbi:MAG TPA: hypothetical protein VFV40_06265, partial [Nocardioides sp.]|nr:hypothetical protein [Nocardioides sp.]
MTIHSTADTYSLDRTGARRAVLPVAWGSFAIATFWTVMGAHDTGEIVVVLGTCAVVAAVVFGFVLPRALDHE